MRFLVRNTCCGISRDIRAERVKSKVWKGYPLEADQESEVREVYRIKKKRTELNVASAAATAAEEKSQVCESPYSLQPIETW